MKYAIFSDVHANAVALRSVLMDARRQGVEKLVCLGDVVGYGPQPREAVALMRASGARVLAGNHDAAVAGRVSTQGFVDVAAEAVARHRAELSSDDLQWLAGLPYTCRLEGAVGTHGDLTEPSTFYYIGDAREAAANFDAADFQLLFVGHTHVACVFITGASGRVYMTSPQDFTLEAGKRYIVNVGTVGFPRDGSRDLHSTYVLYDSTEHTVTFRTLPFAVSGVMPRGGGTRRRLRAWHLAALAGLVLAVAAAVGFLVPFLAGKAPPVEVKAIEHASAEAQAPLAEKKLRLPHDARFVRANLRLANKTPPVVLKLEFIAVDGTRTPGETLLVAKKCAKKIKVPAEALFAEFTLMPNRPGETPAVSSFEPTYEP